MKALRIWFILLALLGLSVSALAQQTPRLRPADGQNHQNQNQGGRQGDNRITPMPEPEAITVQPEAIVVVPEPGYPIRIDLWTDSQAYYQGERVQVGFRTNQDAYFYLFSTDAFGATRLIFPNYYDGDNFIQGGVTYNLPARGYQFVADGPAGRETLTAIATAECYEWLRADFGPHFFKATPFPTIQSTPDAIYQRVESSAKAMSQTRMQEQSTSDNQYYEGENQSSQRIGVYPDQPVVECCAPAYGQLTIGVDILSRWAPRPPVVVATGEIRVRSTPSGAHVYIDGQYMGCTPFEMIIPAGSHELEIVRPGFETYARIIHIEPGRRETYRVRLHH